MRKIGIAEVEDIALGAALLGAGGGGDPYIGKLVAMGALKECGPVTLLDPQEVPDDALDVYKRQSRPTAGRMARANHRGRHTSLRPPAISRTMFSTWRISQYLPDRI